MSRKICRTAAALALGLLLAGAPAGALPARAPVSGADVLAGLWDWLAGLFGRPDERSAGSGGPAAVWAEAGGNMDPNGEPAGRPAAGGGVASGSTVDR